ncbi:hypothetical protein HHK36_012426 [Tetracentron sinense]|uniref:DUF547 domain-containing protein n=1 Tax=Tetracentron sinense TaxID=13715 RepID=A0A834Z979_TETSI|nr:hypothetical protein HHK36_012426 [Tetracentron sinense]
MISFEFSFTSIAIIMTSNGFFTAISDHVPETPNRISEDMIKCMSAIYCKLGLSSSPISPLSSMSVFSPQDQSDVWSPRSLVCLLEDVDPRRMKHEEKLAFWINIHNALVMHVTIVLLEDINLMMLSSFYGSACAMNRDDNPSVLCCSTGIFGLWDSANNMKRVSLLLKVNFDVGDLLGDMLNCQNFGIRISSVIPLNWVMDWKSGTLFGGAKLELYSDPHGHVQTLQFILPSLAEIHGRLSQTLLRSRMLRNQIVTSLIVRHMDRGVVVWSVCPMGSIHSTELQSSVGGLLLRLVISWVPLLFYGLLCVLDMLSGESD